MNRTAHRLTVLRCVPLLVLGLLLPEARAGSAQDPDGERFTSSLAGAEDLLARRRWDLAEEALLALLVEHAGADYVRPHLRGLREDIRRAAFWKDVDEPDPKTLIAGKLLRYTPSNGSIKVRYDKSSLADFDKFGVGFAHPMHFSEAWNVTIEGTPQEIGSWSYYLELGAAESATLRDGYFMTFGSRVEGDGVYSKHFVQRLKDGKRKTLEEADPEEQRKNVKKVRAKISVARRKVRMSYDRKSVFEIEHEEDELGRLVLVPTQGSTNSPFGQVTIDGRIDPGWIGGLIDKAVAEQRAEFDANWKVPAEFDAWGGADSSETKELTVEGLFKQVQFLMTFKLNSQHELFDRITELLGKHRAQAASTLSQLDALPEGALTQSALDYLRFHLFLELQYPTQAVALLPGLKVAPGQELYRSLMLAELQLRAGRVEEAASSFAAVATQQPDLALAHVRHAESLLLLGKPEEAHRGILEGLASLPFSPSLAELELKVVKAAKGPAWEKRFESRGEHFLVHTDVDRKLAKEARKVLDEAWEGCVDFFAPLVAESSPLPTSDDEADSTCHSVAYLFSGEASYLLYVQGIADGSSENTLGVYSPFLKQIAAWNQPRTEDLWKTLRHEVAHRYLDVAVGERIPRWLNEGLAECFAASWDVDGKFKAGGLNHHAIAAIAQKPELIPARAFVTLSETEFMKRPTLNYAQAWLLVYFLGGGKASKNSFVDEVLAKLKAGEDPSLAIDEVMEHFDLDRVEKKIHKWLRAKALSEALRDLDSD